MKHQDDVSGIIVVHIKGNQVFKGKSETQKKQSVKKYLHQCIELQQKCDGLFLEKLTILQPQKIHAFSKLFEAPKQYIGYRKTFTNQIERKLLIGE